jgi:outer membrane protein assembly factor BamB
MNSRPEPQQSSEPRDPRETSARRPSARWIASAIAAAVAILTLTSVLGAVGGAGATPAVPAFSTASSFNHPGDLLITDQFNNRVIEVNPLTKQIVWSFGSGNPYLCNPGPGAIIGPNDAERLSDGMTLMAGTGIPPGQPGTTPCVDNRVIVVNEAGRIVWQYGKAGQTGNGPDLLNTPVFAIQLANHDFLIVDQGNNRVIEVNWAKQIVWSYGPTHGRGALNSPNSAELLPNGNILIADENNNRFLQITHGGHIVWEYSRGITTAAFASRLPGDDTLLTNSGDNEILLVSHHKNVLWDYYTNSSPGSNASPSPSNAVMIHGGDVIIADQFNDRVIVVNHAKQIVFQYGEINQPGAGFDELFGPYTAYEIGDYLGQTPPPPQFE